MLACTHNQGSGNNSCRFWHFFIAHIEYVTNFPKFLKEVTLADNED